MICDIDFTCIDGTRFRLKATLEKEKIDHEETLSQQKKEYMTEVKVCRSKAGRGCTPSLQGRLAGPRGNFTSIRSRVRIHCGQPHFFSLSGVDIHGSAVISTNYKMFMFGM